MSDIKLKPCPFCGAPGKILFSSFQGTRPNGCGLVTFDMDIGCSSCWCDIVQSRFARYSVSIFPLPVILLYAGTIVRSLLKLGIGGLRDDGATDFVQR